MDTEKEPNTEKAANLYDYLMANIHRQVTNMTDDMLACGNISQDERKMLSGALGAAMDGWDMFGKANFADFKKRGPWEPSRSTVYSDAKCIKALGQNRLGGYMVLWGSEDKKDMEDEWFAPDTQEMTTIFKSMGKLPYFYDHALDKTVKSEVIGEIDVLEPDDLGLWYEAQLNRNLKYRNAIFSLVKARGLGTSSGTLPGAREVNAKTGKILRWPIMEGSATPTPCDPRQISDKPIAEIKSAYSLLGLDFSKVLEKAGSEKESASRDTENYNILLHELWEIEIKNR